MLRNISGTLIPVQSESEDFMGGTRDPRTKIDPSGTEDRKDWEIQDQAGPGPERFKKTEYI